MTTGTTGTSERRPAVIRSSWGFLSNSLMAAVVAIFLTRFLEQFGLAISGLIFDREPVITNIATSFRADGNDVAYLGGVITAFVMGVVFLVLFPGAEDRSAGKLTVLWMSLFSFRIVCYELIAYRFSDVSTIDRALAAYSVPAGIDTVMAAAGGVGIVLVSMAATTAFLGFHRHRSEIVNGRERLRFVGSIALVPGLIGPLLVVPFFLPDAGSGYLATLPLIGLFTVITTLSAPGSKNVSVTQTIEERNFSIGMAVAVVVVLVVARILAPGIPIPPWDDSLNLTLRP